MKFIKLFEEFSKPENKIGQINFPDIYVDGFLTTMEDIGVECTTSYLFVYSDYTDKTIDSLLSTSNVLNTKNYKMCCRINIEADIINDDNLSDIESEVSHLSKNFTNADVFSKFNDHNDYDIYIVLDEIIPYSKWVSVLKLKLKKCLEVTGIDMSKFQFNPNFAICKITKHLTKSEEQKYNKATTNLYKEYNIEQREGRGEEIIIDLSLEIMNHKMDDSEYEQVELNENYVGDLKIEDYDWMYFFQELIDDYNIKVEPEPNTFKKLFKFSITLPNSIPAFSEKFEYNSKYPEEASDLSILKNLEEPIKHLIENVTGLGGSIFIETDIYGLNSLAIYISKQIFEFLKN